MSTPLLEIFPPGEDRHLGQILLELTAVALRDGQVVERWVSVKLISGAHKCDIRLPDLLEREHVREVGLVNPRSLIDYTLSFKAAELQSYVGGVPHDHIRASRRPCHVLEVLSHQTVTAAGVCRVNDCHLLLAVTSCIAGLGAEKPLLFQFISIHVFGSQ